jgi:NitT/TauT family transport system substrate-binding protein
MVWQRREASLLLFNRVRPDASARSASRDADSLSGHGHVQNWRAWLAASQILLLLSACAPTTQSSAPAGPAAGAPAAAPAVPPAAPASANAGQSARLESVLLAIPGLNANFLPLFVAEEKGFYGQAGLDTSIQVMDPASSVAGAATGEIPYVFSTTSVMGATMSGQPLREVAFINVGSFMLYGDADLRSMVDLKGKVIYQASRAGLQDYLLKAMLRANGVDPERDVSYVYGQEQAGMAALFSGQVHAAIAQLPVPLEAERQGFKIFGNTADYARFPTAAIGTTVERIGTRPDQVRGMIRGTLQGIKYIQEHEAEAVEIAVRRLEVSPNDAGRILELLRPSWVANGQLADAEIQAVIDERKATLNLSGDFTPAMIVDYRPLTEVQRELGLAP